MAKRRKEKDEEEKFDFKPPKFDEEKFLKRERRNIKTMFLSFALGFIIAIISFGFWSLLRGSDLRWGLVLLLGVVNASFLKYLFLRLGIDLTDFGKKGWFGSYAVYFFTWLLVLMILVNPPFYDDESPRVEVVTLPGMQELGGTVKIIAKITDNAGVEKQDIEFNLVDPEGRSHSPDFIFDDNIFSYIYENTDNLTGEFSFEVIATDVNGHESDKEKGKGAFEYSNSTIRLPDPPGADIYPGPVLTYATTIKFDVGTEVSRVYYTVDGGKEINATKNGDFYETNPGYEGWPINSNVTVKVYADIIHYFEETTDLPSQQWPLIPVKQYNNTIGDSMEYYFQVAEVGIGENDLLTVKLPEPRFVGVPGFELLVFVISLIVVVLIFRYRRKDKRN